MLGEIHLPLREHVSTECVATQRVLRTTSNNEMERWATNEHKFDQPSGSVLIACCATAAMAAMHGWLAHSRVGWSSSLALCVFEWICAVLWGMVFVSNAIFWLMFRSAFRKSTCTCNRFYYGISLPFLVIHVSTVVLLCALNPLLPSQGQYPSHLVVVGWLIGALNCISLFPASAAFLMPMVTIMGKWTELSEDAVKEWLREARDLKKDWDREARGEARGEARDYAVVIDNYRRLRDCMRASWRFRAQAPWLIAMGSGVTMIFMSSMFFLAWQEYSSVQLALIRSVLFYLAGFGLVIVPLRILVRIPKEIHDFVPEMRKIKVSGLSADSRQAYFNLLAVLEAEPLHIVFYVCHNSFTIFTCSQVGFRDLVRTLVIKVPVLLTVGTYILEWLRDRI